jgi:MFS family permease
VSGNSSTVSAESVPTKAEGEANPGGRRNEWLLVAFTGTTNTADAIARVALPLLAVSVTRSPALIAAVVVLMSLPWLVTALHIGVYVDRMNRRDLMVGAELTRLACAGLLLLAVGAHFVSLPLIYLVAAALGVAEVVAQLSAVTIVPTAVPKARWQAVSARLTAAEYVSFSFVGAPIGGLLVSVGFVLALGVTGLIYVAGAVLLAMLVGDFAVRDRKEKRPAHVEIREGLSFLWSHRLLRTMALLITVMAGCWSAWYALIPAYAVGGPLGLTARQYGFLLTSLGAGGVLGTAVVGPLNRVIGRRWCMFVDIVATVAMVGVPALLPSAPASAWAIGGAAFVAGIGGTMWTVNSRVITQSLVPNELLGRFSAASRVISWGMLPLAAAVGGVLAQVTSFRVAFGFFAILCALLVYPFLRLVTAEAVAAADAEVAA